MLIALGVAVFFVLPALLLLEVARCVYLEWRHDRVPILLYHRLISRQAVRAGTTRDDEPIYAIHDDTFEAQMRYLKEHGHKTLSLDDFLAIRQKLCSRT